MEQFTKYNFKCEVRLKLFFLATPTEKQTISRCVIESETHPSGKFVARVLDLNIVVTLQPVFG